MNRYNIGKSLGLALGSALLVNCTSTPETAYEQMAKGNQYNGQQMDCAYIVNQSHLEEGIQLSREDLIDKAEQVCNRQDWVATIASGGGVLLNGVLIHRAFEGGSRGSDGLASGDRGGLGDSQSGGLRQILNNTTGN